MIKYSEINALIIEDFAEFASAVSTMLRNMGITSTQVVTSGEAAIQACRENEFDVILSDYNLGSKKDGQQVLEEIIELKLLPTHCCFIMITAEKTAAMVMAALEFQPDSYLTKPFNSGLLKSRLDKSIKKKQSLNSINKLMFKNKWVDAFKQCEKVSTETPKFKADCDRLKIECLTEANKLDESLLLIEKAENGRPTPWSYKLRGTINYKKNELEASEQTFKQMIATFPMALEGYDWLAKIQHKLDKPVEAQRTLQEAVKRSPKLIKRQRNLGKLAEKNNDYEVMAEAYRQAVKYGEHSIFSDADEYVKLAKTIGKKLTSNNNEDRKKLISEAKHLFSQVEKKFKQDMSIQFRGAVAHADFSAKILDDKTKEKQIKNANDIFDRIEEHLGADESIEIAESLKSLGLSELAECVLEEAVEQYFDNSDFMKSAAKITTNKHLLKNASKANNLNLQAVKKFRLNEFEGAIDFFEQAAEIAPNNVNICLNHAQSLLKRYQKQKDETDGLYRAEEILASITRLPVSDSRYSRYSELSRLNQLMLQKL